MSVFDESANPAANQPKEDAQPSTPSDQSKTIEERLAEQAEMIAKLSKSKEHADEHINRLEAQIKGQAEDLQKYSNTSVSMDAIKQELETLKTPHQTTPVAFGEEDVERILSQREAQQAASANIKKVDDALASMYGDKAKEVITAKSRELGLSPERMKSLASESPNAFLSLVGVTQKAAQPSVNLQHSTINTAANVSDPSGDLKAQYDQLRKENPTKYWSAKVQNEIFSLAKEGKIKL